MKRYRILGLIALTVFVTGCGTGRKAADEGGRTAGEDGKAAEAENAAEGEKTTQEDASAEAPGEGLREETILIPGLERDYTFLFLTDTHISVPKETDPEKVRSYAAQRNDAFRDAEGTSAAEQFDGWMREANERKVDAVLLGGDIIDYPSDGNIAFLQEELEKLRMPYLYTLGNHDWTYPWEYMTDKGKERYLSRLAPLMQENPYVHSLEWEDLLIAAVDDSANQVAPEALEGYEELLQKGKRMIVLLHVPLFTQPSLVKRAKTDWKKPVILGGGIHGGIYPNQVSEEFLKRTKAPDSPVAAVLAGHIHFADRGEIGDSIVQLVGGPGYEGNALLLHVRGSGAE